MNKKFLNLKGQKYYRLTVLRRVPNRGSRVAWSCQCVCGSRVIVTARDLRSGHTKSCGCYQRDTRVLTGRYANLKHGLKNHPLYNTWRGMKSRCYLVKSPSYCYYGARGVVVCREWLEFKPFYDWAVSNGWQEGLTLERRDPNGNYEPNNCEWVTKGYQNHNKRNSLRVAYRGNLVPLSLLSYQQDKISHATIRARVRIGWDVEKALTEPVHGH